MPCGRAGKTNHTVKSPGKMPERNKEELLMKAKMKPHKLLSLLLALVMVVGMLPAMSLTAYATQTTHSVYVYDKDDTGKRYAFNYYDERYYYTV